MCVFLGRVMNFFGPSLGGDRPPPSPVDPPLPTDMGSVGLLAVDDTPGCWRDDYWPFLRSCQRRNCRNRCTTWAHPVNWRRAEGHLNGADAMLLSD